MNNLKERVYAALSVIEATETLCSGYGQYHTTESTKPKEYLKITLAEIFEMAKNPESIPKEYGQWFIPSNLLSRKINDQRDNGKYYAVWCDFDDPTELECIKAVLAMLCCCHLIYSTPSATNQLGLHNDGTPYQDDKGKPKGGHRWRVIIPLGEAASAADWKFISSIINDRFEDAGITPDRVSETENQVCYLPNKGEYYQHSADVSQPLLLWSYALQNELLKKREAHKKSEETKAAQREQARLKAYDKVKSGELSPIKAFDECYPLEQCFSWYGYEKRGNRWLSPNSQSGVAGVTIGGNKWFSKHSSDSDVGSQHKNGGFFGDAFDLFSYYEHGGDRDKALKIAGEMFTTSDGLTISKQNQINNAKQKDSIQSSVDIDFDALTNEKPKQELKDINLDDDYKKLLSAIICIPLNAETGKTRLSAADIIGYALGHEKSGLNRELARLLGAEWDRLTGGESCKVFDRSNQVMTKANQ